MMGKFLVAILVSFVSAYFVFAGCSSTTDNSGNAGSGGSSGSGGSAGGSGGSAGSSETTSRGSGAPAADTVTATLPNSTGWFSTTVNSRQVRIYRPNSNTNLPLIFFSHGTGGDPENFIGELGGQEAIQSVFDSTENAILIFPNSRDISTGDWDHSDGNKYWDTTNDDPNSNVDLILIRTLIQGARDSYSINASRVYAAGHSNGGFFTQLIAFSMPTRIAAFAENSSGWVRCLPADGGRKAETQITFSSTSCTTILATTNSDFTCRSATPEPFTALPTSSGSKVPAYIRHEISDDVVSAYYSCDLSQSMQSAGYTVSTDIISDGSGHSAGTDFVQSGWNFMRTKSL